MGNKLFKGRKKRNNDNEDNEDNEVNEVKDVRYGRKIVPIHDPHIQEDPSSSRDSTHHSQSRSTAISASEINYREIDYREISRNPKKHGYRAVVTIDVDVDTPDGANSYHYEVDEDKFVKMTIDYVLANQLQDASYLIGYKMVYMVDSKRRKIPGVIAIVTLRIPRHGNSIYQSEGKHKRKDVYKMIDFQNKQGADRYYDRHAQARSLSSRSLRYTGQTVDGNGDMVAWEHSTKYCAYKVETIGITILGRLKNVVVASHLYDQNLACAESAFTLEEGKKPVVYEVGRVNTSKHERPMQGIGNCLDFFHFFLHPQYAIDYGFYNFLLDQNQNAIDLKTITVSKRFDSLRKVSYFKEVKSASNFIRNNKRSRDRSTAEFVSTPHGYRTRQYVLNDENNRRAIDDEATRVDAELDDELRDLEYELESSTYSSDSETDTESVSVSTSSRSSETSSSRVSENQESMTHTDQNASIKPIPDPQFHSIYPDGLRRRHVGPYGSGSVESRPEPQRSTLHRPEPQIVWPEVPIAWPEVPTEPVGGREVANSSSEYSSSYEGEEYREAVPS